MFNTPRTHTQAEIKKETPRRKFINSDNKHQRFFDNPTLINLQINNINTVNIERPNTSSLIESSNNDENFLKSV